MIRYAMKTRMTVAIVLGGRGRAGGCGVCIHSLVHLEPLDLNVSPRGGPHASQ
jgi:hypothetical protein